MLKWTEGYLERKGNRGFVDGRWVEEVFDHRLDILVCPQRNVLHFNIVLTICRFGLRSSSLEELPQFSNVASNATSQILQTKLEVFEPFLILSEECWCLSADSVEGKHQCLHFCELKAWRRCHRPIFIDWWLKRLFYLIMTLINGPLSFEITAHQRHVVNQPVENVLSSFPRIGQLAQVEAHLSSQLA